MPCASAWLARSMLAYCGGGDGEGKRMSGEDEASVKGPGRSEVGMSPILKKGPFLGRSILAAHNSRILDASLGGNGGEGSCRLIDSIGKIIDRPSRRHPCHLARCQPALYPSRPSRHLQFFASSLCRRQLPTYQPGPARPSRSSHSQWSGQL